MNSTQADLPITAIQDNLIFLKNGSVSTIISTSAVNFGLLFETEQMAIIQAFAGLLNSLSFPIQIVIRSKRLDVSAYLDTLDLALQNQTNPLLSGLTQNYRSFVGSLIKENDVLDKQFYIALNVTASELGILPKNLPDRTKIAQTILNPRIEHLSRQLSRLGLKSHSLSSMELIKLFYDIYNLEESETPKATIKTSLAPPTLKPDDFWKIPNTNNPYYKPQIATTLNPAPVASNPPQIQPSTPSPVNQGAPFVVEELPDGNN